MYVQIYNVVTIEMYEIKNRVSEWCYKSVKRNMFPFFTFPIDINIYINYYFF